jgi:spore coat polysaccharide biosynthesis protein SpsF (cytidylyltransferase family)
MTVVAIIQARMTSTRLPGKVLMDIGGRPALEQMIRRVQQSKRLDTVAIATTVNATDDPVVELCAAMETPVFRGDEQDVLGRFLGAAQEFQADTLVRLTGDCPMHDAAIIDYCIDQFAAGSYDYLSNVRQRTYPDGLDVEVFTARALAQSARDAQTKFWREHVTTYIRDTENPGGFRIGSVAQAQDDSALRWTLDTAEDLDRIRRYFDALPDGFSWRDALKIAPTVELAA